jgi:hypothetical protein
MGRVVYLTSLVFISSSLLRIASQNGMDYRAISIAGFVSVNISGHY